MSAHYRQQRASDFNFTAWLAEDLKSIEVVCRWRSIHISSCCKEHRQFEDCTLKFVASSDLPKIRLFVIYMIWTCLSFFILCKDSVFQLHRLGSVIWFSWHERSDNKCKNVCLTEHCSVKLDWDLSDTLQLKFHKARHMQCGCKSQ